MFGFVQRYFYLNKKNKKNKNISGCFLSWTSPFQILGSLLETLLKMKAVSDVDRCGWGYNTQFISSVGLINWRSIGPEVNLCADLTHSRSSLSSLHPPLLLSHALIQRKTGQLVHVFLHRWPRGPVAPVPAAN